MYKRTVLYIGWVGFNNHGDDLSRDIFINMMTEMAEQGGLGLDIKAIYPANFNEYTLARINPDLVVLGAGSLFEPVYLKPLILAQQQGIPTAIWGSGYDSLAEGPPTSSQIEPDSAYMIRQVVSSAKLIGVRGPITKQMLDSIGAVNPKLHISGDPGLLLKAESQSGVSKRRIGVNWGTALNRVFGRDEATARQQLAQALDKLTNYDIIIYPVWERDIKVCQELYNAMTNTDSVTCLSQVPDAVDLIDLYQQCTLTINMKLHANVFSAAMNCPFICLAYRLKGLDFAESLELSDIAFSLADTDLTDKILVAVKTISEDTQVYINQIIKHKATYGKRLTELTQEMIQLLVKSKGTVGK